MKEKIFFAGKFCLDSDSSLSLPERLKDDYRSRLLGSPELFAYSSENLEIGSGYIYNGTFYCEKASEGQFTSVDCMTVINAEYNAVKNSDVFFAVLDDSFSAGTVVEIEWALMLDKPIIIMYRVDSDKPYRFKSEYWFAISDAIRRSSKVIVRTFSDTDEIIDALNGGIIGEVLSL